ncbi:MAG: hypothetical protein FWC57_00535, partial [Endomicrobia bacterium]|nr:hypothetical protein [Endomicrobiia bacterium]
MSLKKIFTTLIAIIFTWTAAGSEFARALSLNPAQVAADAATPEIYDGVFKNFARLTSSADFGGDTAVINIQDLHMEPSVQKNISSIIEILVKDYGVENVYVEGGYGKISADWLSKAQNADMRKSIAGSLLNSALITGTEYYCAVNGKKDFLIGLEDENIHKQNIKRLGTILERKPFYEKSIASLRNELEFFQLKYFSHENRRLAKLIDKHKKGYVSSEKYYSILLNYLKRNSAQSSGYYGTVMPLDMKDYPDICLFLYVSKIGKKLNQKTVNRDLGTIVGNIKETVSYSEYKTLLDQTGGFKDIDPLFDFIKRKNISNIPASVSDFMEFNDKSKAVNPVKLITEERLLIENIRVALSKNRNELEVSFLSDMLSYFEDYLKTSISADDSAYLKSRFGKFQSLWEKYSPYNKTMTDLKEDIGLLNEYYAVNDERNEIFLKNINVKTNVAPSADKPKAVYNETVAKLVSGKKNVIVCVTGGYHSKGLTDLLAAGGISYAVLTPMVSGGVEKALKKYEETARAEAQMFSSTLQLSLFSQILSYALAKNDDASRKMAAKFFVSAAEALKDYSFGESNIKELTGYLNEMSGGYYKFDYDAQSGMVKMISKDGTLSEDFIKLSENKDGKILIENRYSPKIEDKIILKDYGRLLSAEEMSKFMSNFKKMLGISTLNYGFDFFAPKIYGFSEHIANWAAEHNIYIDIDAINGLSFDLAEKYGFTNLIDENPALARQSEARQNAAVRKYLRELDYKNDNMGNTEKLIFAADLLNEFLPITHDTMMMYAAYEETSAAKILDEVQSLRIGKRLDYTQFKDSQMPGTAGIRGEIGDITTVSMLQIIAQAQANLALKEAAQKGVPASEIKVVIGGDTRYGGNEFQQAVAGVFAANGFNVEIFDSNIPTPLISFYTKDGKTLGANITASHNKGKDNGYKFTIGGAQANDGYKKELIDEMKKIVEAEKNGEQAVKYATPFSEEGKKRIKIISASAESEKYTEALVDFFAGFFGKTKEEFKDTIKEKQKDAPYLIFEANNGAAPVLLDNVLSALGIDLKNTEVRHWWRDIGYGAATDTDRGAPEPNEANLNNLKTRMSEVMKANEQKTVIGAATDVDADRIGTLFYSDNGQIRPLTPNDIAMIMLYVSLTKKDFVSAPKDLLVRTSPSTHALDYLAAAFGVKTASVNVGSKYIAEHINNPAENVLLGMESSGTILFKEWIKDKEGIMANMLMYLIPLMTDKSYGQLLSEIYGKVGYTPYFSEAKADIKTNEEKTNAVSFFENVTMEEMKRLIKDGFIDLSKLGKNPRLVTLKKSDGLYLGFATDKTDAIAAGKNIDEGGEIIWVQMRASGTENAVRVYAESNEKNITEQLVEIGKKITAQGYDKLKSLRGNRDIKFDEKGKKIETVALKKGNDVLEIRAENEYVVSLSFDGEIVPIEEFNAAIPEGYFAQVPANNSLWRVEKSDENSITLVLSKGVGEWENIWVRNTVTLSDGGIKSEVEIANPKEWYGDAYDKSYIVNYLRQDHPDEVIIFAGDQTQEGGNDYPLKKALLSDQEKTGRLSETIQVSGPDEIIAKLEEAMVKYPGKKFVFAFDLDGTLTKPREHMSAEFAKQFGRWIADKTVYIATGANLEVFKGQTPFDNVLQNLTGVYGSMGNEFYKNEKVEGTDRNEFRQVRVHTIEIDKTDPDLETEFNRYLKEFEENKEEVGYTGELGQGHIDDYRNGRNSINFCVAKPPTSSQSRKLFQDWLEKQDAADGYFSRTSMVKLLSEKFRKFVTAKGGSTSMDIVDREIIEANPVEVKIQGKSETLKTGKTLKFTFEFKKDSALDSFKTAAAASNSSIVQSAPIATLGAVLLTAQMHYALLIIAGIFAVYYAFALFKNPGLVVKNTFEMVILYPVRTILSVLLFPVGLLARLLWIKYEGVKFGLFAEEDKENLALLVQKMHAFMPDVINTLASYSERILSLTDRILRKQIRTKPDLQEKKLLREQIEEAKKMYAAEKEKAEQIIKDNEFGFLLEDSEIVFESGEYRLNYIEFGYADFEDRKSFLNIAEREFTGLGILSNDGGRFEFNQKQDVSDSYIKTLKRGDSDLNLEMVNASLENIRKIGKILAMMEYEKKSKQPQDAKKKYADAISELKTAAKKLNIDMAEPGKNDELFYYFESPSAVQKQKLLNSGKFKLYQTDITEYLCLYSVENNHYIMIPNLDEISSYIGFFAQLAPVDDFEYLQNSINEYEAAADNEKAGALIDLADEIFNNAYYSEHHRLLERRRLIDLIIKAVELLEINAKEYSRGHAKYENLLAISRHAERSLFDNNSFNAALKRLNNAMKPFGIKYYKGPSDWIFSFDTPSDEEALKKIVENEKRIDRKIRWESGYGRINSLIRLHDDTFLTEEEIHTLANLFEKTEHPAQSGGLEKFLSFALPVIALLGMGYLMATGEGNTEAFS